MIYEVHWSSAGYAATQTKLASAIKECGADDKFVFIVTNSQKPAMQNWITKESLQEYELFKTDRALTNHVHKESGRNLTIIVLGKGKVTKKTKRQQTQLKLF